MWVDIPEFPNYMIDENGQVRNKKFDRPVAVRWNREGICFVGLSADGEQRSRSIAPIVADLFVPKPSGIFARFDTPIHLNGDRSDCRASNLVWRPRHFAVAYHKQFAHPYKNTLRTPVVEAETGQRFSTSMDAAVTYGLLDRDVVLSTLHIVTACYPTGQSFYAEE